MKRMFGVVLACLSIFLLGCAATPAEPVVLEPGTWSQSVRKVVLFSEDIPEPSVQTPGAGCLLCVATARAIVSSIAEHFETLSSDEMKGLPTELTTLLESHNIVVVEGNTEDLKSLPKNKGKKPGYTSKDYSALAQSYGASHVLVLEIFNLGAVRNFSSYVPTGAPVGAVKGQVSLIESTTNQYLWYLPLDVTVNASGQWDEPPTYPGLTNAFYQAMAMAKEKVLKPLAQQTISQN